MTNDFVLTMLLTFVYDRENENHWSLLIIRYSLLGVRLLASGNVWCGSDRD